jgi:hypothetical protein
MSKQERAAGIVIEIRGGCAEIYTNSKNISVVLFDKDEEQLKPSLLEPQVVFAPERVDALMKQTDQQLQLEASGSDATRKGEQHIVVEIWRGIPMVYKDREDLDVLILDRDILGDAEEPLKFTVGAETFRARCGGSVTLHPEKVKALFKRACDEDENYSLDMD